MEAKLEYHSRGLVGSREDETGAREDANLRGWKLVQAIRYRQASQDTRADTEIVKGDSEQISLIASLPGTKEARLYSVLDVGGHTNRRKSTVSEVREKTKLKNVACLGLADSGVFAVAAIGIEKQVKVFDLGQLGHPIVQIVPYPECSGMTAKQIKALVVPAPEFLAVSEDGLNILLQSKTQGTMWLWAAHDTSETNKRSWMAIAPRCGGAHSVSARFAPLPLPFMSIRPIVDMKHVYCDSVKTSVDVAITHRRSVWSHTEQAYQWSIDLAHKVSLQLEQSWAPAKLRDQSPLRSAYNAWRGVDATVAVALNFEPETETPAIVVIDDPFAACSIICRIGEITKTPSSISIRDLVWTFDGCFLALSLSNGAICLVSSGGEPVRLYSAGRMRPRYRFAFRHLQSYEEDGSVPSQFGISAHPSRSELTWCDGNRNLVVVSLPTFSRPAGTLEALVSALGIPTPVSKQLEGLHGHPELNRTKQSLLAWALCANATELWQPAKRRIARRCSMHLLKSAVTEYGAKPSSIARVFSHIVSLASLDFRLGLEFAFLTRSILLCLLEAGNLYGAAHILRMAEAYFHSPIQSEAILPPKYKVHRHTKHLAVINGVTFDRQWLLLGVTALRQHDSDHLALGQAALGYGQQRARAWALHRARWNRNKAKTIPPLDPNQFPSSSGSTCWKGHDLYLRGKYRMAENAYIEDSTGAYPFACLLLRQYRVGHLLVYALRWLDDDSHMSRYRASFRLIGQVLSSVYLQRQNLAKVPSPCANPTSRSLRSLSLKRLESVVRQTENCKLELIAELLIQGGAQRLAEDLLGHATACEGTARLLQRIHVWSKFPVPQRSVIVQRQIAVALHVGSMEEAYVLLSSLARFEPDHSVRQGALRILLTYLSKSSVKQTPGYCAMVCARPKKDAGSRHPLVLLGRAALKLLWTGTLEASWQHEIFDHHTRPFGWFSLFQLVVAMFWSIETSSKEREQQLVSCVAHICQSQNARCMDSLSLTRLFKQGKSDTMLLRLVQVALRLDNTMTRSFSSIESVSSIDDSDDASTDQRLNLPLPSSLQNSNSSVSVSSSALEAEASQQTVVDSACGSDSASDVSLLSVPGELVEMSIVDVHASPSSFSTVSRSSSNDEQETSVANTPSSDLIFEQSASNTSKFPLRSFSESSSSGFETESPWIFTKDAEADNVPQEKTVDENDVRGLSHKDLEEITKQVADVVVNRLENKMELLFERSGHTQQGGDLEEHTIVEEEVAQVQDTNKRNDYYSDESEDEQVPNAQTSNAARRFLRFAKSDPHHPKPGRRGDLNLEHQVLGERLPTSSAVMDNILREVVPKLPGVPKLLQVKPRIKLTAQQHHQSRVIKSEAATQTMRIVVSSEAQTDEVRNECTCSPRMDQQESESPLAGLSTLDPEDGGTQADSIEDGENKQEQDHVLKQEQILEEVESGITASGPHSHDQAFSQHLSVPSQANQGDLYVQQVPESLTRATFEKKNTLQKLQSGLNPLFPAAPPKMYLNLQSDGRSRFGVLSRDQHCKGNYLHVCDLGPSSAGIAGLRPSRDIRKIKQGVFVGQQDA